VDIAFGDSDRRKANERSADTALARLEFKHAAGFLELLESIYVEAAPTASTSKAPSATAQA